MKNNVYTKLSLALALALLQACQLKEPLQPDGPGELPSAARVSSAVTHHDVQFGWGTKYDNGQHPSSASFNGGVIEVHKAETEGATSLWYRYGVRKGATIEWSASRQYDNGREPAVAVNREGDVLEVHETSNIATDDLWCRVGRADANSLVVNWRAGQKLDWPSAEGHKPSAALVTQKSDGGKLAVIVLQSKSNANLNYLTGYIGGDGRFQLNYSATYDKGVQPSVSMNTSGQVVEVHKSQSRDALFYRVGRVEKIEQNVLGVRSIKTIVRWGPSYEYDGGVQPSVAITENGTVVEVHKSQFETSLWRRVGYINGDKITWAIGSEQFDRGKLPVVAVNPVNNTFEHSHEGESTYTLWYSNAKLWDRSNWMGDLVATRGGHLTLKDISMPGSHDAGMYKGLGGPPAITQNENLYFQLRNGARYFDLRCDTDLRIRHTAAVGASVEEVLDDVRRFMDERHREVVILHFNHLEQYGFKDKPTEFRRLTNLVNQKLLPYLFHNAGGLPLIRTPLQTFLSNGQGKVLVLFDLAPGGVPIGMYSQVDDNSGALQFFDKWSNTEFYERMKSDQFSKFSTFYDPGKLFVFSWTLTPQLPGTLPPNVLLLAKDCNPFLGRDLKDYSSIARSNNASGQKMNILFTDFHQSSRAADICWYMNHVP